MRFLLIEDDAEISRSITDSLVKDGHSVVACSNGEDGISAATAERFDAMIVDLMLPGRDGFSVIETVRGCGSRLPIIVLTARNSVADRVRGLEIGSDDYLVKPFALAELQARLHALVRRTEMTSTATKLRVGELELDILSREAVRAGVRIQLLPREFQLLEYLLRHAGQVVTREMLLKAVWNYEFDPQTNVIEVHISRLRGKIDRGFPTALIQTVRAIGFTIREPD
jgi:two-component system OmpR family response regulator